MKIESLIIKLLYEDKPVKLENLGTIHPVNKGAEIHPGDHQFEPPKRTLSFDPDPQTKDDGLAQLLAKESNISHEEALRQIRDWSQNINQDLKSGKKVQLKDIGFLVYDFQGKIKLEVDQSFSFSKEGFGLPSFQAELITPQKTDTGKDTKAGQETSGKPKEKKQKKERRKTRKKETQQKKESSKQTQKETPKAPQNPPKPQGQKKASAQAKPKAEPASKAQSQQKAEEQAPPKSQKSKKKRSPALLITILLVLILGAAGWYFRDTWQGWINTGDQSKLAESQSAEETQVVPGDTLEEKAKATADSSAHTKDGSKSGENAGSGVKNEETDKEQEAENQQKDQYRQSTSGEYLIIAGCFRSGQNAQEYVEELRNKGFDASIQGQTPQGLQKVVYGVYKQKSEAITELRKIRQKENSGAWLDKK